MLGERWNQSPEDWQQLIVRLLKIRYSIGEFIEIPDAVHGDCGLEGFGRDGKAFQCYSPDEPLSTAELSRKLKAKITADLAKLITNAIALQGLLGPTKLRHWILVVPRWEDKAVQIHAETKAQQIRKAGLAFIEHDFMPAIQTCEDFLAERRQLTIAGVGALRIVGAQVGDQESQDWVALNDDLVNTLDRKCLPICHGNAIEARKLRDEMVRHYLDGRNALEKLRSQYPELYELAYKLKEDKERFLATESLIPDSLPPQKLRDTLERFKEALSCALPGLSSFNIDQLVHEAASDWLLRCPLNFPAQTSR